MWRKKISPQMCANGRKLLKTLLGNVFSVLLNARKPQGNGEHPAPVTLDKGFKCVVIPVLSSNDERLFSFWGAKRGNGRSGFIDLISKAGYHRASPFSPWELCRLLPVRS